MGDSYCGTCMTEARRIGEATGQNVSEVYRYFRSGNRHRNVCVTNPPDGFTERHRRDIVSGRL